MDNQSSVPRDVRRSAKKMKTYQWLLLLFAAVSLVSAFVAMEEGPMPIVFILM